MKLNSDQLKQAREWLKECTWDNVDADDFDEMSDLQIQNGIRDYFAGGIRAFIETCEVIYENA